ncbi:MAG: amidohydrolase family protein [Pseudomonadota bacterium]
MVDGTGSPARRADVAVKDGKIAEIGKITDGAHQVINAADCIVAPGFVDPHTHYDAQICWDPAISPSSWHGVTSVVMGNCGVGIARAGRRRARSRCATSSMSRASRSRCSRRASPGTGRPFPSFSDAAAQRGSALNLGFLAPLTPFRHYVMGADSLERAATPAETAQIKALLAEAVAAGALGFSTTNMKPASRLSGAAAGLPQRQHRRAQGLLQCPQGERHRRDRAGAQQAGLGAVGRGIYLARSAPDRERAAR